MKSYIVIGLGRFGQTLARQLCALGAEVLAIDKRGDLVQQVADDVTHAVVGDGQDKEVLRALGARNFDCAIIAIGSNLASSVLSALPAEADLRQAIQALSRSLLSLDTVDGVRLLVDGELVGGGAGTLEERLFAG